MALPPSRGEHPLGGCETRTGTLVCWYRLRALNDHSSLEALVERFGRTARNRAPLSEAVAHACGQRDLDGSTWDGDEPARCPPGSVGCLRWRRRDATGERCRRLMAEFLDDPAAERARQTRRYCAAAESAGDGDCRCVNRALDPEYRRLTKHDLGLRTEDRCWFAPCVSRGHLADPDQEVEAPCSGRVCLAVTAVEAGGDVKVDRSVLDLSRCAAGDAPPAPKRPEPEPEPAPLWMWAAGALVVVALGMR